MILFDRFSSQNCPIKRNDGNWLVQKGQTYPAMSGRPQLKKERKGIIAFSEMTEPKVNFYL